MKVGLQGFELALRRKQELLDRQHEVEATDPEEAKRIGEKVEELDHWIRATAEVSKQAAPSLWSGADLADLFHAYWEAARPTGRYRGGAIVPGSTPRSPRIQSQGRALTEPMGGLTTSSGCPAAAIEDHLDPSR